jgi:hypothetical protein
MSKEKTGQRLEWMKEMYIDLANPLEDVFLMAMSLICILSIFPGNK